MQTLLPKISVVMDPGIPARFETMHVRLRVELNDGTALETRCDGPLGMWGQPKIDPADHLVKVRDCLSTRLSADAVEQCIALASRIDSLQPDEIGTLMKLVA